MARHCSSHRRALGKAIGWIFSPIWVDMIPIFGGVATVTDQYKGGQRCCRNRMLSSVMPEGMEGEIKAIDKRLTVLEASRAET